VAGGGGGLPAGGHWRRAFDPAFLFPRLGLCLASLGHFLGLGKLRDFLGRRLPAAPAVIIGVASHEAGFVNPFGGAVLLSAATPTRRIGGARGDDLAGRCPRRYVWAPPA